MCFDFLKLEAPLPGPDIFPSLSYRLKYLSPEQYLLNRSMAQARVADHQRKLQLSEERRLVRR